MTRSVGFVPRGQVRQPIARPNRTPVARGAPALGTPHSTSARITTQPFLGLATGPTRRERAVPDNAWTRYIRAVDEAAR